MHMQYGTRTSENIPHDIDLIIKAKFISEKKTSPNTLDYEL